MLGLPFALSFDTDDYGDFVDFRGVDFHYLIFGAELFAGLSARQDFRFTPDLKVKMAFPEALDYWIVSNGVTGPVLNGSVAEMHVGDTLHLTTPSHTKQPTPVAPTFRLDNQFHSETGFQANEGIDLAAGDFGIAIPEVTIVPELCTPAFCVDFGWFGEACFPEICTPEVNYDPPDFELAGDAALYNQTIPIAQQELGNIFSGDWQLEGFAEKPVSSLSIDPENPIVRVTQLTGAITNLGYGKRLVPLSIDVANPGDVPLSSLSLKSGLAAAFADARGYSVQRVVSCGATLNPDFDGNGSDELLAAANVLGVGGLERITVYAIVSPQPDPPAFTSEANAEGTSPIATLVNANNSSSVSLGPGAPGGADDFVVFGDHFVKLNAIADSSGDIGSNEFIEVKEGVSGNVAGDLRAKRLIRAQGQISADYAFSGGGIELAGAGNVQLYGSAKLHQNLPSFVATTPSFSPSTPLKSDVWVGANDSRTIDPGYYTNVTVNSGGQLDLRPGAYFIRNVRILAGGSLLAQAPSSMTISGNLELGANTSLSGTGSSRATTINVLSPGAIEIERGAAVRGVLVAPRSNVMFLAGSSLEGSVYGKSVTLEPGVSARYHRDCDTSIDPDCDGTADCP